MPLFKRLLLWLTVFILAFISSFPLFAQSQANTGTMGGTVTDSSGQVVANAQVNLTNTGTNLSRDLTTDDEGRFRGLLLPLGGYRVTVTAKGFGTLVREGLDLNRST